jgi:ABC-2 type transport system ATP-binding protein
MRAFALRRRTQPQPSLVDTQAGPVVEAVDATKQYAGVTAVDRVSLRVEQGEIYALLGLNGAGKTTLIRMLLGMVRPSGGRVSLFGERVYGRTSAVWSQVGYLVETPAAYPELTVRENLDVIRRLRRIRSAAVVNDVIEQLGLSQYAEHRARILSLGNGQRLGLAKALLHRPRLLLLDEPANGLDPAGVVEVRDLLHHLAANGCTVLLSSHILGEVARLATRIGIIHSGQLRQEMDTADLARLVSQWLCVRTRDDAAAAGVLRTLGFAVSLGGDGLRLHERRAVDAPDEVATALVGAGLAPTRLSVEGEDLETYFLRTVGVEHA